MLDTINAVTFIILNLVLSAVLLVWTYTTLRKKK